MLVRVVPRVVVRAQPAEVEVVGVVRVEQLEQSRRNVESRSVEKVQTHKSLPGLRRSTWPQAN